MSRALFLLMVCGVALAADAPAPEEMTITIPTSTFEMLLQSNFNLRIGIDGMRRERDAAIERDKVCVEGRAA